ncbi:hypothetical protein Plhal703r1_c15g0074591 [Plasmopara halstedii]
MIEVGNTRDAIMESPRSTISETQHVTLGPQVILKKNSFQGLLLPMLPLEQQKDLNQVVLDALTKQPRLQGFQNFPRASRVYCADCNGPDSNLVEECHDQSLKGVGDRLLYLLQRWQVTNVVLIVAHKDSSLSGRLLGGPDLYKLTTKAAKLVLEQHYSNAVDTEKTRDKTTFPLMTDQRLQQIIPSCVMSSDTVPTWPKHHQATTDGGGRKGGKQGRINHFRHREFMAAARNQEAENVDWMSNDDISSIKSSGNLEWMGVTREEWETLRKIRMPVQELHYLYMCLVILLDTPPAPSDVRTKKRTMKQQEHFEPSDYSWTYCRQVLHQVQTWSHRLRGVQRSTLTPFQVTALHGIFQYPSFTENAFVRIAKGAGLKIYSWVQNLLKECTDDDLGLLRLDVAPEVTIQTLASPTVVKLKINEKELNSTQSLKEKASIELQGLQNESKSPKALRIVDPGRLFGNNHA